MRKMADLGDIDRSEHVPACGGESSVLTDQHRSLFAFATSATANVHAGPSGALYGLCAQRPLAMQALGRVVWGIDASILYRSLRRITPLEGVTIADVPCGGGVAFRALRRGQEVRYVAGDARERMLVRATRRARRRKLSQVEVLRADMMSLPFADGEIDVFLCHSGIHMQHDGLGSVAEIARCLRPGGRLIGTGFFSDMTSRARRVFELDSRHGHPMPPSREDMYRWMRKAGLAEGTLGPDYGFAEFNARKP